MPPKNAFFHPEKIVCNSAQAFPIYNIKKALWTLRFLLRSINSSKACSAISLRNIKYLISKVLMLPRNAKLTAHIVKPQTYHIRAVKQTWFINLRFSLLAAITVQFNRKFSNKKFNFSNFFSSLPHYHQKLFILNC